MAYTKILWRNNKYVLQVKQHKDGKFKQIFASEKKSVVNKKRAEVQAESINVGAAIAGKTFVDTYKEFYEYKIKIASNKYSKIRLASVTCYKTWYGKYIKPYFDNRVLLTEITPPKHARPFFLKLRELGVSWIQAKIIVMSFQTCLKFAVEEQYIDPVKIGAFAMWSPKTDPATMSPNLEEMEYRKTPMISLGEVVRLIKYLEPNNHQKKIVQGTNGFIHESTDIKDWQRFAVISTFIFAGMRMSEVRGLKWDCVDLNNREIEIKRTVVGNGSSQDQVKALGSKRTIIMHKYLYVALSNWKRLLRRYYGDLLEDNVEYKQSPLTYVFPSLRNTGNVIPLCDGTITDWVKLAFAAIGIAKVKVHPNKNGDHKAFVEVLESRYKKVITRTFRHFYITALCNAQTKHPETLTNNYVKGQAGHRDYKTTSMIYGDHLNFDNNREKQQLAIDDAIPIGIGSSDDWSKNTNGLDKEDFLLNP